jgi:hypothetical protein
VHIKPYYPFVIFKRYNERSVRRNFVLFLSNILSFLSTFGRNIMVWSNYRLIIILLFSVNLFSVEIFDHPVPFRAEGDYLAIWNGSEYVPFFIKGTNLGVSVPGTFPGEMAASREQYARWFQQIKDAGFNSIRLYTLHFPRFFEVLDSFNVANSKDPLLFFQGVWLEEELEGYTHDLTFLTESFRNEIEENIDCIHGNRSIADRRGKAFGDYTTDASKWCLGYIIGREVYPDEISTTNENHPEQTAFIGEHFQIKDSHAAEVLFTSMMDFLVQYERDTYDIERPVSVSSWPTLDPMQHPEERFPDEDRESVDLSKIVVKDAPAGFFISYHAYPYYPGFVSYQTSYQNFFDAYGKNSYMGYLTELKSHYEGIPLIIAEYGVPSSWGVAHYSNSGLNHGGFDESGQGEANIRLLHTIQDVNCGGGIQFAWIDEWFKRTWITDHLDFLGESRILWHNVMAAEQNYGLLRFDVPINFQTVVEYSEPQVVSYIKAAGANPFFQLEIGLREPFVVPNEMWIALDTYGDDVGESQFPDGETLPFRSEFFLHLTNHTAQLYVTEAYDLFGVFHNISLPVQKYHSTATDGAPWNIVRWKNNTGIHDIQYVGDLRVSYGYMKATSKDAVIIDEDKIHIRLPWTLISVIDPSQRTVFDDDRSTPEREYFQSEGFNIAVRYLENWYQSPQRYVWEGWNGATLQTTETLKSSYSIMKERLAEFNTPAFAVRDSFYFSGPLFPVTVSAGNGLLANDFDLDGKYLSALLIEQPSNGKIQIQSDGSFSYFPNIGFTGADTLHYAVYDGLALSQTNSAIFVVESNTMREYLDLDDIEDLISIFPNPSRGQIHINVRVNFDEIMIFNVAGKKIYQVQADLNSQPLDLGSFSSGIYVLAARLKKQTITKKFTIIH